MTRAAALILAGVLSLLSGPASAQTATMIPAFKGGVRDDAVLKDPQAIMRISSHCYDAASKAKDVSAVARGCIDDELKQMGAGVQAIAFADYAPVPAAIEYFVNYREAAAVYAVMRWADGASGWCLIGISGEAIGMWEPTGAEHDPKFTAFAQTHPSAMLWMPADKADAPSVVKRANGNERLVFPFTVKSCHACAIIGRA
ncbi:MAG TPA: hypothetical protein VHY56_10515 [Candidatus Binataceae bacterium]|nr:hypothetical protein [Candidatus Binataceae bacterium]